MPLETIARSPEMRQAAHFLRYLRHERQSDSDSSTLADWERAYDDRDRFAAVVRRVTGLDVEWCGECGEPQWDWTWYGAVRVDGGREDLCNGCCNELCWCDDCDEYSREPHDHGEEEEGMSSCEAPNPDFRFPVDDGRSVGNDERFEIETAGGVISAEGMEAIAGWCYYNSGWRNAYYRIREGAIEPLWQTSAGNFTKRLAKLYLQNGYKLEPEHLTAIGNLARQHASQGKSYSLEFTRNLNLEAADFYHGGSCWWGSEFAGRCALKQCGGLAVRTFSKALAKSNVVPGCNCRDCKAPGRVAGRAWIMPLDELLHPTQNAESAYAYMLFNAYGHDGYEFARILAQLTGKSYRKIPFGCRPMWINNDNGFLIASPAVCQRTDALYLDDIQRECECES